MSLLLTGAGIRTAGADGFSIVYDRDMTRLWSQRKQFGAIAFRDGVEHLLIAVNPMDPPAGSSAVWLFPVPSAPGATAIAILDGFPDLRGRDVEMSARKEVADAFGSAMLTQVYPYALLPDRLFRSRMGSPPHDRDVQVYQHVESRGLVSELVSAKDGQALVSYLQGLGATLPQEARPILDEYAGRDFSFVVSWLRDLKEFERSLSGDPQSVVLGIHVSFPAPELFYPLRLTAAYGEERIPIALYVMDWVVSRDGAERETGIQKRYFMLDFYSVPETLSDFFFGGDEIRSLRYTKIEVDTNAGALTSDLWLTPGVPKRIGRAQWAERHAQWAFWIALLLLGPLSSGLWGFILFRRARFARTLLIPVGLANFATLAGVGWALAFIRTLPFDLNAWDRLRERGLGVLQGSFWVFLILAGLESALLGICLLDRHPNELLGSFLLFSMIFMLFAGLPLCSWRIVIPPKKRDREAGILWTAAREWRVIDLGKLGILVLINGIIGPAVALLLRPDRGTGYQTAFEQPYYVIATVLLTLSLVSMAGFEKVVRPRLGWKWLYAVPRDRRKIAFFFLNSLSFVVLVWLSGLVVSELLF